MAVEAMEKQGYESPELFDHYGDILMKLGNEREALANWRKARELDPEIGDIDKKISEAEKILKERGGENAAPGDSGESDLESDEK